MRPALVDTDVLSLYLRGDATVTLALDRYLDEYERLMISQLTYYEVLRGLLRRDARRRMVAFRELVAASVMLPLTETSLALSAQWWAQQSMAGRPTGELDLLIAGTAAAEGLVLVTRNRRHFEGLTGLALDDWTEL